MNSNSKDASARTVVLTGEEARWIARVLEEHEWRHRFAGPLLWEFAELVAKLKGSRNEE